MMFDNYSVQWMMFAIQAMMVIYNLLVWRAMRSEPSPLWWALANVAGCVSALAFLYRDPGAGGVLNVALCLAVVTTLVCVWIGLRVALGLASQAKRLLFLVAAQALVISLFTFVIPILWVRFVLTGLLIMALSAGLTRFLWRSRVAHPFLSLRLLVLVFSLNAVTWLGTTVSAMLLRPEAGFGEVGFVLVNITTIQALLFSMFYNFGGAMLIQERLRDRFEKLAVTDALTGLPNRHQLPAFFGAAQDSAQREQTRPAVCVLDLDGFKEVNDMLGHQRGDRLLVMVAEALKQALGSDGRIARLGGDEFAIILDGRSDAGAHLPACHRMLNALRQPFDLEGTPVHIGGSIGLALVPAEHGDLTECLRQADIAMYSAKESGRDGVCVFAPAMDANTQELARLRTDLRRALPLNQCHLLYQPKWDVSVTPHRLVGVEALLRWQHPIRGLVPPAVFIPLAEASGLIGALGDWVLEQAVADAAAWPDLTVAVNLSPLQFEGGDLVPRIQALLTRAGVAPQQIELELTEGVFLRNDPVTRQTVRDLRALGTRLALDDFGTGYSSLGYLKDYRFHTVKIDRSFIRDSLVRPEAQAITQAVIQLARTLQVDVVAEGVETPEELDALRAMGCTQVQGFLLGRPMRAPEITALMAHTPTTEARAMAASSAA
jgi:diguanylate cyclase (GGDEF)-like protein